MMEQAALTRDEAYGLLSAVVEDPYYNRSRGTEVSRALSRYIVANDLPFTGDSPGWLAPTDRVADFPCRLALVTARCSRQHDWRPLEGHPLVFIPFARNED